MSVSSPTPRSVGLALGSALAVAAILFAAFTALSGPTGTSDSKPPRPHTAPASQVAAPTHPASGASPSSATEPACKLFDTECQEENPSADTARDDDSTADGSTGATPRVPDPPQGTAATGGGGALDGAE
ncbi:hypothetical protein [Streptomyces sp. DW26H14]|uniref:hypothetical protein n=1 Tax=Streptomyces sp. DW26H14 TaxID=3435395 RepID=UPI00403DEF63